MKIPSLSDGLVKLPLRRLVSCWGSAEENTLVYTPEGSVSGWGGAWTAAGRNRVTKRTKNPFRSFRSCRVDREKIRPHGGVLYE